MFFHGDQVFICFTVRFWGKRILFHQLPCGYSTLGDVCFKPRLWKLGKLQKNTTSHWRGCFASWKVIPDDQTGCEIRSKPPKWWLKAQQNKGIWYTIYQLVIRISQPSTVCLTNWNLALWSRLSVVSSLFRSQVPNTCLLRPSNDHLKLILQLNMWISKQY